MRQAPNNGSVGLEALSSSTWFPAYRVATGIGKWITRAKPWLRRAPPAHPRIPPSEVLGKLRSIRLPSEPGGSTGLQSSVELWNFPGSS